MEIPDPIPTVKDLLRLSLLVGGGSEGRLAKCGVKIQPCLILEDSGSFFVRRGDLG